VIDQTSIDDYGLSEWFDQRNDIMSQIELDAAAASELKNRKDPLKNIQIVATGQTGIKYAGQTVTVHAPKHGLNSALTYRIVSYHHQYRKNPIKGAHSFITNLDLVSHELSPTTQVIDPRRYTLAKDPVGTALEILALTRRRVRSSITTQRKGYGDTHPVAKTLDGGLIILEEIGLTIGVGGELVFMSDLVGGSPPDEDVMARMYPYYVEPGNYGLMLKMFNTSNFQVEAGTTEIIVNYNGSIFLTTATQIYTRKLLPGQAEIDIGAVETPYDEIHGNKVYGARYG